MREFEAHMFLREVAGSEDRDLLRGRNTLEEDILTRRASGRFATAAGNPTGPRALRL